MTEQQPREHRGAPDPDDRRKPDEISDLTRRSWRFILRRTVREFISDDCTDLAAALTYYAVLALFPALLALVSLLGLVGQGETGAGTLVGTARQVAPDAADTVGSVIGELARSTASGVTLVLGLAVALWSASGYVGAFGRALNRVYEVDEGRPFWKLRPVMLLVTLVAVVLVAAVALGLVVTGPVAETVGSAMGLGDTVVTVWNVAKWPVMLAVVIGIVALLYHATPNVRQPRFRWISLGAAVAVVVWILASVGFGVYVANFSSYDKTYGSLAGVVVFLLWLWITNLALLFGAELDAETERGRQLQAGIPAEDEIQLPPRDTRAADRAARQERRDRDEAQSLRRHRGRST